MNVLQNVPFIYRELKKLKPKDATAEIKILGEYDPKKELIIEDPYYVSAVLWRSLAWVETFLLV